MPTQLGPNGNEGNVLIGMVLLKDDQSLQSELFLKDLREQNSLKIEKIGIANGAIVMEIDGESVSIMSLAMPVPWGDIESTAAYAYNWETAVEDLEEHKGHIIVSVMYGVNNTIKRFQILTTVICSLLRTSNAIGVYKGTQCLLIPKDEYLSEAGEMSADNLPLNLWIYFGLLRDIDHNSGYTLGLSEFGKKELEVVGSENRLSDIKTFLFNIAHALIELDVTFRDGQTFEYSEWGTIKISLSKGHYIENETFKLEF
jgi:hypothetical protein